VISRFTLPDLKFRVLGAPMAGGVSTPALAAAVTNAGGLGFLAGGLCSADDLADSIVATRKLTSGALGVNLFVPQASAARAEQLTAYATALEADARHYGVVLGEPRRDRDEWAAKLEAIYDLRPEVVSFTFGAPSQEQCRRLAAIGALSLGTVTTVREAVVALGSGVDALVAQGPDAGGHRATFEPTAVPPAHSLHDLVMALVACVDCPVVAAGGIGTYGDVRRLRDAGATAVQVGTALLRADEAGTSRLHREALRDPQFIQTAVTRAFTGRYARALRNRFIEDHDADAIAGFPEVAMMTAPLQAAALKTGDPHGVALWAGAAFRAAEARSAAEIVRELAG
jgi:nitronate monooxygenase